MALAKKEFDNRIVRTYKRGNDEINLNDFIRQAEYGFNSWLDSTDIKDKNKGEVRAAYRDLITRINDDPESFVARLGGGFTNTAGITNNTKGFDSYGIAAGYLGKTLRGMPVYSNPDEKPLHKKDSMLITPKMQSKIWGDNPDILIKLDEDSYDKNTGLRGVTNRVNQTITGLKDLREHLRDYKDFDSDESYNHALSRIDSAIGILQNKNPNDDWFALEQLGFTRIGDFLSTGTEKKEEKQETANIGTGEQAQGDQQSTTQGVAQDSDVSSSIPTYTLDRIVLNPQVGHATEQQQIELINRLGSLTNQQLKNWIGSYITHPEYDYTHYNYIIGLYGGVPSSGMFTSDQIMSGVLAQALNKGLGQQISKNLYYFPFTLEHQPDGKQTVYVYNLDNFSLEQVDTSSIQGYIGKRKNGGIIKAKRGFNFSDIVIKAPDDIPEDVYADPMQGKINQFQEQRDQEAYENQFSPLWSKLNYGTNQEGNVYGPEELLPGWKGSRHDRRTSNIGKNPQTPNVMNAYNLQRKYIHSGNMVGDVRSAYQNWKKENPSGDYQQFVNYYNDKVQTIRDLSHTKFAKGYNNAEFEPLFNDYNWLYSSSAATLDPKKGLLGSESKGNLNKILGSTMFNRVPLAFNSDSDVADLRSGTFIDNDPSNIQFWINNEGKLELRDPNQTPEEEVPEPDKGKIFNLEEALAKMKELSTRSNLARRGFWEGLGTDLLGASRLAGSILSNNKISRIVRDSLQPKLHDTYELYSPVTGAFGEMQLRNRQGADVLSQSSKPFTSDASLASARMLEGQRLANELQYQGFLADDREIKRTQAEALQRQEGNIARRSALANENRDAIIANNQALAQLEASRIKQNWNSIDNYLAGIEGRTRQRLTEDREQRNQFAVQVSNAMADQFRTDAINQLKDKFLKWQAEDPEDRENLTFTDWATQNTEAYTKAMQDINAVTEALKYRGYAQAYGIKYDWPTHTDEFGNKTPIEFNINDGRYKWLKYGGTLGLSSNQLIDKIIRKNEGNS